MFLCPDLVNIFHKNTFDPYFILRSVVHDLSPVHTYVLHMNMNAKRNTTSKADIDHMNDLQELNTFQLGESFAANLGRQSLVRVKYEPALYVQLGSSSF